MVLYCRGWHKSFCTEESCCVGSETFRRQQSLLHKPVLCWSVLCLEINQLFALSAERGLARNPVTAVLPSAGPFAGAPEMPTLCSHRRLQPPELPVPSYALCTHMVRRKDRAHQEKVLLRMGKGSDCFGGRRKITAPSFLLAQPLQNGIRKPC